MLNSYCYYAYQGLNKGDGSNVQPAQITTNPDISSVTADQMIDCRTTGSGSVTGLTLTNISLNLESTTELNIKMRVAEGHSIEDYSIAVDGVAVRPVKDGDRYVLTIHNIAAKDLDRMYTVTISANGETQEIHTCALSYCYTVLERGTASAEMQNISRALYLYNQAANAYFGS